MRATTVDAGFREERWALMTTLSICLHLAVFSTILFIPQTTIRLPSVEGRVHYVELVDLPLRVKNENGGRGAASVSKAKETSSMLHTKTRRIALKEKKPLPIVAKRVSPKPKTTPAQKTHSPSELIDKAISKIERKVEERKTVQPEEIQKRFENDTKSLIEQEKAMRPGMLSDVGIIIKLYQMEIESAIKNNWSYPVALVNLRRGKVPEAVVILTVRRDGKILKTWFKRRSKNPLFDDSVLKAIKKSDPLPGFPPGYRKTYDELEINFSLKDLA
jgi:colicin import membrane protein